MRTNCNQQVDDQALTPTLSHIHVPPCSTAVVEGNYDCGKILTNHQWGVRSLFRRGIPQEALFRHNAFFILSEYSAGTGNVTEPQLFNFRCTGTGTHTLTICQKKVFIFLFSTVSNNWIILIKEKSHHCPCFLSSTYCFTGRNQLCFFEELIQRCEVKNNHQRRLSTCKKLCKKLRFTDWLFRQNRHLKFINDCACHFTMTLRCAMHKMIIKSSATFLLESKILKCWSPRLNWSTFFSTIATDLLTLLAFSLSCEGKG